MKPILHCERCVIDGDADAVLRVLARDGTFHYRRLCRFCIDEIIGKGQTRTAYVKFSAPETPLSTCEGCGRWMDPVIEGTWFEAGDGSGSWYLCDNCVEQERAKQGLA